MNIKQRRLVMLLVISMMMTLSGAVSLLRADTGTCNGNTVTLPFTDVAGNFAFCWIAEAYFSGLTGGTSATTYSPTNPVTRDQMAVFITRSMDQALKRGNRRAAAKKWWKPQAGLTSLGLTNVDSQPRLVEFDGEDLWVANQGAGTVTRVHASDGRVLGTYTGATGAYGVLVAAGHILVTGNKAPGALYLIDPTQPPGPVQVAPFTLGDNPSGIAFDGERIWTANAGSGGPGSGSISIYSLSTDTVSTVQLGFNQPLGMLYDGSNIWVTDQGAGTLLKLDAAGQILQTVTVGTGPMHPVFDGANIWVPNFFSPSVTVVRAASGSVLATLTGNLLSSPTAAAFDGERILITCHSQVSLFRATDFAALGSCSTGLNSHPQGVASDGLNFWITLSSTGKLARF